MIEYSFVLSKERPHWSRSHSKGPYIEGSCCIPYLQGIDPHWNDFLHEAAHVGVSESQFSLRALRILFNHYEMCVKHNKPFLFIPRVDVQDKNRSVFEFPSIS